MAESTARYIGLRTYRYAPVVTSRSVGATGAGVPSPSRTKRTKSLARLGTATRTSTAPAIRTTGGAGLILHRVSHHGSTPATTPGARAKNSALPSAARRSRIRQGYARVAYRLPRFFAAACAAGAGARFGGFRSATAAGSAAADADAFAAGAAPFRARLALRASIRSITWVRGGSAGAMDTGSPAIFASMTDCSFLR